MIVDCTALTVPRVAVDGITTEIADVTEMVEVEPLPRVVLRKANAHGFKVTVIALAPTDAVTG
jgi:hypothetical protein